MTTNNPEAETPTGTGPATVAEMRELHRALLNALLWTMRNTPPNKLKATTLEVLRAFLKDNGVVAPSQDAHGLLRGLESLQDTARFPFKCE